MLSRSCPQLCFVADRTHGGKAFRMLTAMTNIAASALRSMFSDSTGSDDVMALLTDPFALHGPPAHIRSEVPMDAPAGPSTMGDGAEFTATPMRGRRGRIDVKTLYIGPRSP